MIYIFGVFLLFLSFVCWSPYFPGCLASQSVENENASFLGKGLESGSQKVQMPTTPRSIVETYSCDDAVKHCMLGNSSAFQSHGLSQIDLTWSVCDTMKLKHCLK